MRISSIRRPSVLGESADAIGSSPPLGVAVAVLVSLVGLGMGAAEAAPADHFVTTWKTDNPGSSNNTSILVPMIGGPYDVDWDNDGTFDQFGLTGDVSHDFGVVGTYTIRIDGAYDSIRFLAFDNEDVIPRDRDKIVSLDQWGTQTWTTMEEAFYGCSNLEIPATDTPDFSAVTSMAFMFEQATLANPDTSGWDTSSVVSMWHMFSWAISANPDTSAWDTSSVTDMSDMFYGATSADPDTSGWDTSAVRDMSAMFAGAISANPDTSGWNVSSLERTLLMFKNATSANPATSGWNVMSLTDATDMFLGVTLSTANYEALLINWSAQGLQPGVTFSGGNSTYCSDAAATARANMINTDGWIITDGGRNCSEVIIFADGFEPLPQCTWIPDVEDPSCLGWDPGEPYPPRTCAEVECQIPPPGEPGYEPGWELCIYVCVDQP